MTSGPMLQPALLELNDEEAVRRILEGETALFETIMRRYNQRLYRVTRAILRNDSEAEDVIQDAYVRAYQHLDQFAGKAAFATWLTRIAIHEALARKRRRSRKIAGKAPQAALTRPDKRGDLPRPRSSRPRAKAVNPTT